MIIIRDEASLTEWIKTADAIFRDELKRAPGVWYLDPAGLASMLQIAARGGTAEDMIAAVRTSPEWAAAHAPKPMPTFTPAPREYSGNMCGVRIEGLPMIPGGGDPSLVLSWFYDRYDAEDRARIRQAWKARGYLDVLLSWPDSRAFGEIPQSFVDTCNELTADGFRPCPMLCSKDHDSHDTAAILTGLSAVVVLLASSKSVSRVCIGWELSLWLSPAQVQELIDVLAPVFTAYGCKVYVHFQEGYAAFSQEVGGKSVTADFWKRNVGLLTGLLHERDLSWDKGMYQARLVDILQRMAGQFGWPSDSGFGHPFDLIALEITAQPQFNGQMTEAEGDEWGDVALNTPAVNGVRVMGSGNGRTT